MYSNVDGRLSNSLDECLLFWSKYCEKLYELPQINIRRSPYYHEEDSELDSPITYSEFIEVLSKLKNNKAPGSDFITNDDLKMFILPLDSDDPDVQRKITTFLKGVFKIIKIFCLMK